MVGRREFAHFSCLFLQRMYLVMELCEGGEMADILKEKKYFMESEVKIITKELCSAIAYLHKNGEFLPRGLFNTGLD